MNISFKGSELRIGDRAITITWPILEALDDGQRVIVLLDPDSYLSDPAYQSRRRAGAPPNRNLLGFSYDGVLLWEADLPSDVDYYYRIASVRPLRANSFSSFRCEIDPATGRIIRKDFYK